MQFRTARSTFFFCRDNGTILNAVDSDPVVADALQFLSAGEPSAQSRRFDGASGRQYHFSMHPVAGYPYNILILQENQQNGLALYLGTALVATLFLLIAAVSLNLLISRYLTRPLDQIIGSLKQVTHDSLDMDINFHSSCDDLKQLQQFYNEMLARVRESMNLALQSRINEREAYHMALQSQISPHFLFNCIGNISAIAYENDAPEIMMICERMSHMLRYASNIQRDSGTVDQELAYTRNYLELMCIRYEGELVFTIESDGLCDACAIPRLMIQTVVENCFMHGFSDLAFPWSVHINVFAEEDFWMVEVIDNGAGIDEARVQDILCQSKALYNDVLRGIDRLHLGGLGLLNSITRLRLLYNDNIRFAAMRLTRGTVIKFGGAMDAAGL